MNISLCLIILISTSVLGASIVSPENPLVGKCAEYEYPWKVLIKDEESGDTCEGSIINFNHILIQASCVTNKNKLLIHLPGVVDAEKFPSVRKISIYPGYERENSSYDFAILTLTESLVDMSKSKNPNVISWMEEVIMEPELAIIITGGDVYFNTSTQWNTVELLRSNGSYWCSLPDLPGPRLSHTQNGLIACGGRFGNASSSCVTFTSGEWVNSHSLLRNRETHFSWTSLQGVLLMGSYGDDSTELLSPHGISHENFTMKLPNYYSCTIQLKDKVIVTGGSEGGSSYLKARKVIAYNLDGWLEDLPDMINSRFGHGCGHFTNTDGVLVYLVTGGKYNSNLVSTEILVSGAEAWKEVGELPLRTMDVAGVSIDNRIIMTGGSVDPHSKSGYTTNLIVSFNTINYTWETVGTLAKNRSGHAASVVRASDVAQYCKIF